MNILIPTGTIVPLFLASFILYGFQYFRISPDRRVLNLHFAMMLGAIVLALCTVTIRAPALSMIFQGLALFWLVLAVYLFRLLPPP